jgi:hypothetical protein
MVKEEAFVTKIMKKHKNIIVTAVLLVALVTVYLFASKHGGNGVKVKENDEPKSTAIKILEFDSTKVRKLSILTKDGKYEYTDTGNGLMPSYPKNMRLIPYQGAIIVSELMNLSAQSIVNENATNLAQYGLKDPETITAFMKDGKAYTVEVGNQLPSGNGTYLKLKGENKVYNTNSETGNILTISRSSIWNYLLYNLSIEEISGVTLEKDGNVIFSAKKENESKWDISSPVIAEAKIEKINQILASIKAPTASELVEVDPKNLNKYGLQNPKYTCQIETSVGKAKILFGNEKIKGTLIYAKLENINEVFTISEKYIDFADTPIQDMANPYLYTPFIYDISKIVVNLNGKTSASEIAADSTSSIDDVKYKVNGKSANVKDKNGDLYFEKYYAALVDLNTDRIVASAKPSGKQESAITYYLKEANKVMKIGFVPKDKNNYFIFKNNRYSGFIIAKSKLNEVKKAYDDMMKELK